MGPLIDSNALSHLLTPFLLLWICLVCPLYQNDPNSRWMADYSIRFDGCSMVPDFEREEGLRGRLPMYR